MPPRGYRNFSIREDVYKRFKRFMDEKGITSINDAVVLLLDAYDMLKKLLGEQSASKRV